MSKKETIVLLKRYLVLLKNSGIPIHKAFLYGSYANDHATEESDIDVMIISPLFDNEDIESKAKAWSLTRQIDTRIEPYTVGLNKFLVDDISPLIQIIKKEGIELTD